MITINITSLAKKKVGKLKSNLKTKEIIKKGVNQMREKEDNIIKISKISSQRTIKNKIRKRQRRDQKTERRK